MLRAKVFRARWLAIGVAAAFTLLVAPVEAVSAAGAPQAQSRATGSLIGFIYGADGKTPVEKAVIKIRNTENGKEYASGPTDSQGIYRIQGIEEGRYALGVTTAEGDFNFEYQVLIKSDEVAKLSLALKAGAVSMLAQEEEEKEGGAVPFFKRPIGIAVLIAASGLAIYGVYKGLEALGVISPSKK